MIHVRLLKAELIGPAYIHEGACEPPHIMVIISCEVGPFSGTWCNSRLGNHRKCRPRHPTPQLLLCLCGFCGVSICLDYRQLCWCKMTRTYSEHTWCLPCSDVGLVWAEVAERLLENRLSCWHTCGNCYYQLLLPRLGYVLASLVTRHNYYHGVFEEMDRKWWSRRLFKGKENSIVTPKIIKGRS